VGIIGPNGKPRTVEPFFDPPCPSPASSRATPATPSARFDQWLLDKHGALTYPYFHDGAANTLGEAVDIMGRIQLGKKFTQEENAKIVAFLKTLTGDQPSFQLPILPPSSDKTPRPTPFK
jgi:cytochrome c peroxidase